MRAAEHQVHRVPRSETKGEPKVGGIVGGCTVTCFFCDFPFFKLPQKILLLSKSKFGEMLSTGGRGDLSGQL